MSKITIELKQSQVEELVEKLPIQQKIKLAAQLDKETWNIRFGDIVKRIRQRTKKSPISEEIINKACQRVQTRLYRGKS